MIIKPDKNSSGFPKATEWYVRSFAEDYLWLYAHRSEKEAAEQVRQAIKYLPFMAGQKLLDIACGAGRHMLAFARKKAIVTGVDLSEVLLKRARVRFRKSGLKARLHRGDMRQLSFRGRFDGVTMWFTSFGYFPAISDDKKVLGVVSSALKPGGWWLIDLPNPVYLAENLIAHSERTANGPNGKARIIEDRRLSGRKVIKVTRVIDGAGERVFQEVVRLYRPDQFAALLAGTGLTANTVLGDYNGVALSRFTPRQIWLGSKQES